MGTFTMKIFCLTFAFLLIPFSEQKSLGAKDVEVSNSGYDYLDSSGWFSGSEADKDFSGEPWDMDSGSEAERDFSGEPWDMDSGSEVDRDFSEEPWDLDSGSEADRDFSGEPWDLDSGS